MEDCLSPVVEVHRNSGKRDLKRLCGKEFNIFQILT